MSLRGHVISSIYSSSKWKTKLEVILRYHEVVRSHVWNYGSEPQRKRYIDRSSFTPTKKVKDRLIVKFTRREKRDEIYSKRKNLKSKRTKDLPSVVCEPESAAVSHKVQIHVDESLTPYRKRLLGRIFQFKRDHNYKFIWTANG